MTATQPQPGISRETINDAIAQGEWSSALAGLKTFFAAAPTLASAQFVLDRLSKIESPVKRTPCRIAFLRSFTLEPVIPLLRAEAGLYGVDVEAQVGDFNTYVQDVLDPNSALYAFAPHVAVLAVQTRDLVPALWERFADLPPAEIPSLIEQAAHQIEQVVRAFRNRSQAHLVIHNLELPTQPAQGIFDAQIQHGQAAAIAAINARLTELAQNYTGVYLLDYDGLVARQGRIRWHDERKWLTARLPIASDCLIHMAREYTRFVLPLVGWGCKVLAVDLDNTLWGGVIGEDGMTGIALGSEYPGAAFTALQRVILNLSQRGVILAACSKNNLVDAMEAIENHAGMILRPSHFAALRINWQDKAQNLREIAAELNVGIDSVAFLDDNPVERTRVAVELPEVQVIELPSHPMGYAQALAESPVFERLTLSAEDRERGRYYAEQRQRTELEQGSGSLEDFYRSLQQVIEVADVTPESLARTAQLTQKTNQFNVTTRRYSEQEIEALRHDPNWRVVTLRVEDRFGDNGLVGVALLHRQETVAEIDTLLMSCRVIGRTVETAFLAALADIMRKDGAETLEGWFLPTKKNAPAQNFYLSHGFASVQEKDGGTLWRRDIAAEPIACPEWIVCRVDGKDAVSV